MPVPDTNSNQPDVRHMSPGSMLRWLAMPVLMGCVLMSVSRRSQSAEFVVSTTADAGAGSLRQAVLDANATVGVADTIRFNVPSASQITLTTGELAITDSLTITGPGSSQLTVDGNNASRIFNAMTAATQISISGLTLQGGNAAGGAGILIDEAQVSITDSVIRNCASTSDGGALYLQNGAGTLLMTRTVISGNTAAGDGGGLCLYASATIDNCSIVGNSCSGGDGGGIDAFINDAGTNVVTIRRSTISGNTASGNGGGVFVYGANSAVATIENSTISGNSATNGGGIEASGPALTATIRNSTIASNTATTTGPGLRVNNAGVVATLESTIAANNQTFDLVVVAGTVNASNSLIEAGSAAINGTNTNNINTDPRLGPLQNNGGFGQTHALLKESLAIDSGSNSAGLTVDERGQPRTAGNGVDIGAFELQAPKSLVVTNTNDSGAGSLRQAIADSNENGGALDVVTFQAGLSGAITLTTGELAITDSLTITGPGSSQLAVSGNNASRIFNATTAGTQISISGLTLQAGSANGGAGILIDEAQVSITDSVIRNCASTSDGGALYLQNGAGTLSMSRTVISGNTATGDGGGLCLYASATIDSSSIVGNSCSGGGGGGIDLFLNDAGTNVVTIRNTTISGNTASGDGGGVYVYGANSAVVTIENSTISGNNAVNGGGVEAAGAALTATIRNSTIALNNATTAGDGVRVSNAGAIATLENTIVGGNPGTDLVRVAGTVNASSSIVQSGSGAINGTNTNNIINQDPLLGALANNGGPTLTHLPAANSPAKNAGTLVGVTNSFDQRGAGFFRFSGTAVDVGAVEIQEAPQAGLVVTNTNDSGTGSLRQAVLDANAFGGPDTITFQPGLTGQITLTTGEIAISDFVTISGPGKDVIAVSGNNASRIFNINAFGNSNLDVSISGLTLKTASAAGAGGAIFCLENLVVTDSVITGNKSTGKGAGIYLRSPIYGSGSASLTIKNCTISNNDATARGGGVFFYRGTSSISDSVISGNSSTSHGGGMMLYRGENSVVNTTISDNLSLSRGGGFKFYKGTLTVDQCVISGNTATNRGGGIMLYKGIATIKNSNISSNSSVNNGGGGAFFYDVTVTVENTTISGNFAQGDGGGVMLYGGTIATIRNSTIVNNRADANGNATGTGGGIFRDAGSLKLDSTIVALNTTNGGAPVKDDFVMSVGLNPASANNLIGVDTGLVGITNGVQGNKIGTAAAAIDPLISPLALNDGTTPTHAIAATSPALNAGSNPANLATDQRGAGFRRVVGTAADIGAFELNRAPSVTSGPTATPSTAGLGQIVTFAAPASDADNDTLTYTWDFGDGSTGTGAAPTHAYAAAGTYNVKVTITDGNTGTSGTVSGSVTVVVVNPILGTGNDSDGDGFSDSFEILAGTDPDSAASNSLGGAQATPPLPLTLTSLQIKLSFKKSNSDSISLAGTLPIPAGFSPAGKTVTVDVGGVVRSITLDAKGKSPKGNNSFKSGIKAKKGVVLAQTAKFAVKLSKGSFASLLTDEGLTNANAKAEMKNVVVRVVFANAIFEKTQAQLYTAKAGSGGATKSPK